MCPDVTAALAEVRPTEARRTPEANPTAWADEHPQYPTTLSIFGVESMTSMLVPPRSCHPAAMPSSSSRSGEEGPLVLPMCQSPQLTVLYNQQFQRVSHPRFRRREKSAGSVEAQTRRHPRCQLVRRVTNRTKVLTTASKLAYLISSRRNPIVLVEGSWLWQGAIVESAHRWTGMPNRYSAPPPAFACERSSHE